MADDTDEDAEWDRWMSLTDEQQNLELDVEMRRYQKMLDGMTRDQYYRHFRRRWLENVLLARRNVRALPYIDCLKDAVRRSQLGLVKLREFHRTGIWPGEA